MSSTNFLFSLLFPLLLLPSSISSSQFNRIPWLSILGDGDYPGGTRSDPEFSAVNNETQTFFFDQTLDHFNYRPESYTTFKHKYVVNFKYWGGANSSAPIFAFLGGEEPVDLDIAGVGFLTDNAPRFKALIVYIEHRFYGESIPYGLSLEEALKNADIRGYFNSAQALADYAEVIIHVKKTFQAQKSPVIVMGGSYGGMLASWFRLKYPHIAIGAFASSAPILLPVKLTPHYGYYSIVSKGFKQTSVSCWETIKRSWSEIDRVASKPQGLSYLSKKFRTCKPLKDGSELKDYLISKYAAAAQYNNPFTKPVANLCSAIDSNRSSSILSKIFAGVVATRRNSTNSSCYDVNPPQNATQTTLGWPWQACSDIIIPLARNNQTMFQTDGDSLLSYVNYCKNFYGVAPRPHWIPTYFGGQDIKLLLGRFGSNIIFSNGLKDPYSNGGVLENISDTIHAVYTARGSHCLDIIPSMPNDPAWLVKQRMIEVKIIQNWIDAYYSDLKAFRGSSSE